ncbi:HET-domain-containing protein [Decorospora gaudefroyi]|uniref:HET-domain-containing protein n=1 Tax=Decorospora gaudefroyi TaxID=184978 RepID=A0A6A5JVY1_9PLEO|nr:HET-domain-containing protein [Decorospora gaudefroyi]
MAQPESVCILLKMKLPRTPVSGVSHCWGKQPIIRTTTSNLDAYAINIPWENLSKTFQDAVSFTYRLDLKYLWIDSLCIIQDSIDDWRREGSRMSQIYKNAIITLAATGAADGREGCFLTSGEEYTSRKKSSRIVTVGCMKSFAARLGSNRSGGRCSTEAGLFKSGRYLDELSTLSETYRGSAQKQSHALTYADDIFPALQGVAKEMSPGMGRYLAGHWESTLTHSLCWRSSKTGRNLVKRGEWRAPSWSWARLSGKVFWDKRWTSRWPTCITLLSALTTPKGNDPMGQLSYGAINIRGRCLNSQIVPVLRTQDKSFLRLDLYGNTSPLLRQGALPNPWWCYPS